jgi:hypothetical protein
MSKYDSSNDVLNYSRLFNNKAFRTAIKGNTSGQVINNDAIGDIIEKELRASADDLYRQKVLQFNQDQFNQQMDYKNQLLDLQNQQAVGNTIAQVGTGLLGLYGRKPVYKLIGKEDITDILGRQT